MSEKLFVCIFLLILNVHGKKFDCTWTYRSCCLFSANNSECLELCAPEKNCVEEPEEYLDTTELNGLTDSENSLDETTTPSPRRAYKIIDALR